MGDRAQWQVAGSAPDVYELELVPAIFEPWARRVVGLANLQPGDRVLDLACGTGVVARIAAEEVGERGRSSRPTSILGWSPSPDRSGLHAARRSNGGRRTPVRCLSVTKPLTLLCVSSVCSSSPTVRSPCVRCVASCVQAVASSSWCGAGSTEPLASPSSQRRSSSTSGQRPDRSCEPPFARRRRGTHLSHLGGGVRGSGSPSRDRRRTLRLGGAPRGELCRRLAARRTRRRFSSGGTRRGPRRGRCEARTTRR